MELKKCSKCNESLTLENFRKYKNRGGNYVHRAECIECEKKARISWRSENKERLNQEALKRYWSDPEIHRKKRMEYFYNNREKERKYRKEYYEKNKESEFEYSKRWRKANKEKWSEYHNNYHKKRKKDDPLFYLTIRTRSFLNDAFRRQGYKKNSKTEKLLGCSYEALKNHIESQFRDGMNWDSFDKIHLDHIIPLSSAKTEKEVIALSHYMNIQPLWEDENLEKWANYDPEFKEQYLEWYSENIKKLS